jgi:hypothetical protein
MAHKLEELEATLFLNAPDAIRAKISEIIPEYSYLPDNPSDMDDEEEPWPRAVHRKIA